MSVKIEFISIFRLILVPAPSEIPQPPVVKETTQPKIDTTVKTCSCDYGKKPLTSTTSIFKKETEEQDKIDFENALHNVVYIKKT